MSTKSYTLHGYTNVIDSTVGTSGSLNIIVFLCIQSDIHTVEYVSRAHDDVTLPSIIRMTSSYALSMHA